MNEIHFKSLSPEIKSLMKLVVNQLIDLMKSHNLCPDDYEYTCTIHRDTIVSAKISIPKTSTIHIFYSEYKNVIEVNIIDQYHNEGKTYLFNLNLFDPSNMQRSLTRIIDIAIHPDYDWRPSNPFKLYSSL